MLSFVIDANIARASGLSEKPSSSRSRNLLDNIKNGNHEFVQCPTLKMEWKKHASGYSIKWLASMYAKKKVITVIHENYLRQMIEKSALEENRKSAALKDSHIIDSANLYGKLLATMEKNCIKAFCEIPELDHYLQSIYCINPIEIDEIDLIINEKTKSLSRKFLIKNN